VQVSRTQRILLLAAACSALAAGARGGSDEESASGGGAGQAAEASGLPQGKEPVDLDPSEFTTRIDNQYFPLRPGTKAIYDEQEDGTKARVDITVTHDTKQIEGVTARVVHDLVSEGGEVIEDTYDWYAQDADGNVWYLGEDTTEYKNGKAVTKEGSWEAGVDGAQAGIIMPADPDPA
jgi:hypothetical protein